MVARLAAMQSGGNASRNRQQQGEHQRRRRQLHRKWIAFEHEVCHRVIQPDRSPQISMQHATPVVNVLAAQRLVEPVCVTQRGDVRRTRALAQHLLHRIAGHDVDEQKDYRHNQPQDGQRIAKPHEERSQEPFHPAAFCATGSSCSTLTLLMRLPFISSTVRRRPSYSMLSPP